jgi:diaminopimelate epimerase
LAFFLSFYKSDGYILGDYLMTIPFFKMHGLGNDFVIIDTQTNGTVSLDCNKIVEISNRRYGVGCDQLLVMEDAKGNQADFFMRIYNADGSESGACGNGTRCVARLWMERHSKSECIVETEAGDLKCRILENGMVEVDMGAPKLSWDEIPLSEEKDTLHLGIINGPMNDPVAVNMGNPHTIFFVDEVEKIDIEDFGSQVECNVLFPERTNVEFAQVLNSNKIRLRVWERGAGVTQACGSGACATIVASVRRGLSERKAEIILDGGSLFLEWRSEDDHVLMSGPATYTFEGAYN